MANRVQGSITTNHEEQNMNYLAGLLTAVFLTGISHADEGFDYAECSTIRDVTVPYEIEVQDGIYFHLEDQLHLSVTPTGELLDASGRPFDIGTKLENAMIDAVHEFVRVASRFAEHFGPRHEQSGWHPDQMDSIDGIPMELFADSCRNLYDLKQVQAAIGELDPSFSPVIFVYGFDRAEVDS